MKKNNGYGKNHPTTEDKKKIIDSYKKGKSISDLAEIFNLHPMTLYRWIRESKSGSDFQRKPGSGRASKIEGKLAEDLIAILQKPATDFNFETILWNIQRIKIVCKKKLGLKVSIMAIWRFLKKIDYSCKKVQKVYQEASEEDKSEWTQKIVPKIKRTVRKHKAILYFEDESNISLSPVMGTSWSLKGVKIKAKATGKRGSVSAISAISHDGRLIFSLHDSGKRFNSDDIINFLSQVLGHHPRRHIVMVMDRAPCHRSKKVREFIEKQKRLHVFYLPAYSPEFNPDEQVWNYLKNHELKNHDKTTTKELKSLVRKKLNKVSRSKNIVNGIFKRCEHASLYKI